MPRTSLKKKSCRNNASKKMLTMINTKIDLVQETLNTLVNKEAEAAPSEYVSDMQSPVAEQSDDFTTVTESPSDNVPSNEGVAGSEVPSIESTATPSVENPSGMEISNEMPSSSTEVPSSVVPSSSTEVPSSNVPSSSTEAPSSEDSSTEVPSTGVSSEEVPASGETMTPSSQLSPPQEGFRQMDTAEEQEAFDQREARKREIAERPENKGGQRKRRTNKRQRKNNRNKSKNRRY